MLFPLWKLTCWLKTSSILINWWSEWVCRQFLLFSQPATVVIPWQNHSPKTPNLLNLNRFHHFHHYFKYPEITKARKWLIKVQSIHVCAYIISYSLTDQGKTIIKNIYIKINIIYNIIYNIKYKYKYKKNIKLFGNILKHLYASI